MQDVIAPPHKQETLERYEKEADRIDKQYQRGLMTAEERRGELIEIWTKATNEVAKEMDTALPQENPLWKMINSGARGNLLQLRQIAAAVSDLKRAARGSKKEWRDTLEQLAAVKRQMRVKAYPCLEKMPTASTPGIARYRSIS